MANSVWQRVISDGSDRDQWLQARAGGVTATDVAKLSSLKSIPSVAKQKLSPLQFTGNSFTAYGRQREPLIADWVQTHFGINPSNALFCAAENRFHLATPDGIAEASDGSLVLAEIKTTNKVWSTVPRNYMRQIFWQQYVLGADRTLLVWEQHQDFVPTAAPQYKWIERDEEQIEQLMFLADKLVETLREMTQGRR